MSSIPADEGTRLYSQAPRLRLLCLHLAGNAVRARVDVEDLVQETFLRALADLRGLPPAEPGEPALYRFLAHVARHCVIDAARALRARKREARVEPLARGDWSRVGVHESQIPDRGPGVSTQVAGFEESRRFARTFLELAPEHRRVIGLRQFEGLSAAETARRMGRSEAAVHSLYRRALEAWETRA